nr:HDOD domain-containing protein [Nitrospiraceae bacterium]
MARLLIIDDDPDITEILDLYGDFLGYEADRAAGWQEAEKKLAGKHPYSAVFCDLTLQGTSGLQIFERINELDSGLAGRFVLLTGAFVDEGVERVIKARKIRLVKKPFNFEDIKAVLQSMDGRAEGTRNLILQSAKLPAVPLVATRILDLISRENTAIEELQEAIMADSSLTTRMLQMANSAFFRARQSVDTISEAVSVLGFNTIRSITLAVSTRDIYKPFGFLEEKLWEHNLGVSLAAAAIASEIRSGREEAAIAGLLHDTGKLVMNCNQPERYLFLAQSVQEEKVPFHTIETEVFGFGHAEVGSLLGEKWGLSDLLCGAIMHHHGWKNFDKGAGDDVRELSLIVALSDALCTRL